MDSPEDGDLFGNAAISKDAAPKRVIGRPFQPGQSGNPSGRARIANNVREIARQHTADAINALVEIVQDKSHPQRVAAANSLLDRGYGKPIQQVEVGKPGAFAELSEEELDLIIVNAAKELRASAPLN